MSWKEIDLAGLSVEMETVPDGNYVFSVLAGSKYGNFQPGKIEVPVKVMEGEYAGRVVYTSFPDPAVQAWSPVTFKRLELALVADGADPIETGADPVEYLNNGAVGKRFIAPLATREYTGQDGELKKKTDIRLFKIRPLEAVNA